MRLPALPLLALLMALAGPLAAQNLLFVEHGGKPCLVVDALNNQPCIELDGKVVDVRGDRLALKHVEEYLPVYVAVTNLEVGSTSASVNGGSPINTDLHFHATFETPYRLDHVFLLLDMDVESAGKVLFLYQVGHLEPRDPKSVSVLVPLARSLGSGHFQLHLFVGGAEALHSAISSYDCDLVVDRMIAKRVAKLPDGGPKPFLGPAPTYPAALLKTKVDGQAVITLWIRPQGSVRDPVVKSATDPAFGEAALAAARLWRFLPRIKDGHAVETKVDLPFIFTPPGKTVEKS